MTSVPVKVEPPGLNPVVEVGYDGQELTQPPLTMSENLRSEEHTSDSSHSQQSRMPSSA